MVICLRGRTTIKPRTSGCRGKGRGRTEKAGNRALTELSPAEPIHSSNGTSESHRSESIGPAADRPRGSKRATHARLRAGSGPGKVTGSWGRDADSDSPAARPGTARAATGRRACAVLAVPVIREAIQVGPGLSVGSIGRAEAAAGGHSALRAGLAAAEQVNGRY